MAALKDTAVFSTDFSSDNLGKLQWLNPPAKYHTSAKSGTGLKVYMDAESDFWQKTYYDPPLMNDNGHLLHLVVNQEKLMMETTFEIEAGNQFDQGGLMVYLDKDCWIKAGIEWVDGKGQLSCVVTNIYSDWSVQSWPTNQVSIRIYKLGNDFVVEVKDPADEDWHFIRICHLNIGRTQTVKMGVLACAPKACGGHVLFHYLAYQNTKGYHHSAE